MTDSKCDVRVDFLRSLGKVSWVVLFMSLLIDTCHTWSFPSYNIIIGVFSCYIGNVHFPEDDEERINFNFSKEQCLMVMKSLTCFTALSILTIVLDMVYCSVWARQILDGENKSAKFSLAVFILNMFVKLSALFYAVAILVHDEELKNEEPQKVIQFKNDSDASIHSVSSPGSNEDEVIAGRKSPSSSEQNLTLREKMKHLETDGYVGTNRFPAPPFSPGLPGLVSPLPPKPI